jgi:hypothetical protein
MAKGNLPAPNRASPAAVNLTTSTPPTSAVRTEVRIHPARVPATFPRPPSDCFAVYLKTV